MVAVLVILDGASEPLGPTPTSLERARTPALDRLTAGGTLMRLATVAPGLEPGSEAAIPALLGWTPTAPVDRALLEAAARGISLPAGHRPWRIDVRTGTRRAGAGDTRQMAARLRAEPGHAVHEIGGHRLLVCGPPPLPIAIAREPALRVWPEGVGLPRILNDDTVMIAAAGAAAGVGRLMGARVVIPPSATGRPDTDLAAKAAAGLAALGYARRVVIHVGGADEAAHERDADGKVAVLERIDAELIAPLAAGVEAAGASLMVTADHGCDPRTGRHDGSPVPCLQWPAPGPTGGRRLIERDVAHLPAQRVPATELVAA